MEDASVSTEIDHIPAQELTVEGAVRALVGKVICGFRVRVELSNGMPRRSCYNRHLVQWPSDPNDRCYEYGEKGHNTYDCRHYNSWRGGRSQSQPHLRSVW